MFTSVSMEQGAILFEKGLVDHKPRALGWYRWDGLTPEATPAWKGPTKEYEGDPMDDSILHLNSRHEQSESRARSGAASCCHAEQDTHQLDQ